MMLEMKEYSPWAKGSWVEIKNKVKAGVLPIIDLRNNGKSYPWWLWRNAERTPFRI